ncbi:RibD family protein [Mucilaginibacter daejeonensis]|uniref:dihydrofolate reductase family protein n=1 Tax=Mucilaginibacter daejeonensis TaxID=398049 RepID=UPI001D1741A5|nr:RibD family protein [Mucilaginibacter daejeonensis]UEG51925.1 RibD family protein [Mucilaginibacter daejeonensis]
MPKDRPYIICLMMTSLDGKILTEKWGNAPAIEKLKDKFEEVHEEIGVKAWIVGRTTMEKDFTEFAKPVIKKGHHDVDRKDYVANAKAESFAIAIDGGGKLGWESSEMEGDHVITILTEGVKDGYLAHLQDIGVSYIFAGEKEVDIKVAVKKLYSLFGIEKLMLEGGGHVNGSFLNESLIDELHQVLLPIADGSSDSSTFLEIDPKVKKGGATLFKLEQVIRIEDDAIWLTYKIK